MKRAYQSKIKMAGSNFEQAERFEFLQCSFMQPAILSIMQDPKVGHHLLVLLYVNHYAKILETASVPHMQ